MLLGVYTVCPRYSHQNVDGHISQTTVDMNLLFDIHIAWRLDYGLPKEQLPSPTRLSSRARPARDLKKTLRFSCICPDFQNMSSSTVALTAVQVTSIGRSR